MTASILWQRKTLVAGIGAQAVTAIGNLAVAIVAARLLGPEGYGSFSLMYGLLVIGSALTTNFVGDYINVHEMNDWNTGAAILWQWLLTILWAVAAAVLAWMMAVPALTVLLFVILQVCWLSEEYYRRSFMASGKFGELALNDLLYGGVACLLLLICRGTGQISLKSVLLCLIIASACACLGGHWRGDPGLGMRWPTVRPEGGAMKAVATFGFWRAGQSVLGALSQQGIRWVVLLGLGAGGVGTVESARTLAAPLAMVAGGVGNSLLPRMGASRRAGRTIRVTSLTVVLGGICLMCAVPSLIWGQSAGKLTFGAEFEWTRVMVGGWLTAAATAVVCQPGLTKATVSREQRTLFIARLLGVIISLLAALITVPWIGAGATGYCAALNPLFTLLVALLTNRKPGAVVDSEERVPSGAPEYHILERHGADFLGWGSDGRWDPETARD